MKSGVYLTLSPFKIQPPRLNHNQMGYVKYTVHGTMFSKNGLLKGELVWVTWKEGRILFILNVPILMLPQVKKDLNIMRKNAVKECITEPGGVPTVATMENFTLSISTYT